MKKITGQTLILAKKNQQIESIQFEDQNEKISKNEEYYRPVGKYQSYQNIHNSSPRGEDRMGQKTIFLKLWQKYHKFDENINLHIKTTY